MSNLGQVQLRDAGRALGVAVALGGVAAAGLVIGPDGAAARPVAAIEDDRFVSAPVNELPGRVRRMQQTRTRFTHVDIFWNEVAPNRPSAQGSNRYNRRLARNHRWEGYDWSRVDTIMTELRRRNIRGIAQVYSYPPWTNGGRQAPINPQGGFRTQYIPWAPNNRHYADFMFALATRYNGRQTVQLDGRNVRLPRIRHFEHGNEVNLRSFFRRGRGANVGQYVRMFVAGARAVKTAQRRVRPRAMNIGGTFGPRSSGGGGNIGALPFIRRLYRNRAFRANADALGGHVYPAAPPLRNTGRVFPSWSSLNLMIEEKGRYRNLRNKPIFITEAGYTTASTPFRRTRVTRAQQARYYRQIFNTAVPRAERRAQQNLRRRGIRARRNQVAMVIIFNMQDNPSWPGGLWTQNFRPKPSLRVFRSLANRPVPGPWRSTLRV